MASRACASCGTSNEADARFCEGCGALLDRSCVSCGALARAGARFCRSCGTPLEPPAGSPPDAPTRKTVTVLFADLAGSTAFEEQVDAETTREVIGRYHELLRSTADHHRAGVTKYIGDGFMAVWGVPEVGADDAGHAVEAAVELQQRFVGLAGQVSAAHGVDLALRVAVNTGEVVVGAGDADLVGDALNVGARLESECPHGGVVVGEETWRATRGQHRYEPMGRVQVKGRAAPVPVYQWTDRRADAAATVPFVGRGEEFRRLQTVVDDAVAHREVRLVTVIGDPGVGKTRLATEFAARGGLSALEVRCATEGSVALAPMVDAIRARDVDADVPAGAGERDRILRGLNALDTGAATSVEETFWALRRYIEVLAAAHPLVVVVDDVQWADPLLLDFLEHLAEWVRDAPVPIIALARPEIRDIRADLASVGGWVSDAIRLRGLAPEATAELAVHVLGGDQIPPDLLDRLPSSTGGNPLFVRELVGMLVHDGVLVAKPDGWQLTIDADAIAVPPTIQALLASRLERMNTGDRRVLELASVIGTDFFPGALGALGDLDAAAVRSALDRLRRRELAQPSGAYLGDEPIWRFHHVLIRDVAYRRLLKSDRAELHERFADWVDAGGSTGAVDPEQLSARHIEAAYGYRCDLGLRDARTATLALRSARGYLAAARRALDRDALVSAGAQAARGAALAAADGQLGSELLMVGCEALLSAGDVAAGAPLVDELDRVADDALAPWATCYRCQYLAYTDPSRLPEVEQRIGDAIEEFARRGDPAGSAKAYRVRANARGRLGRIGQAEADLFEALIAARQAGDHRQITAALGAAPNAALWGPSPAPQAGGRCLDVVRMQRMTTAAPSLEATSLRCLAMLELLRGRPEKAQGMLADAREIVSELGLRHGLMETELYAGIMDLMLGDPAAAEPHFRTALEGLDSLGVGADAGQAAALLARSVLAQGRVEEADRYAAESERIAGYNLKGAIAWRAVRAEILSTQGRDAEAVGMARQAVDVAADTDLVLDHADACLTLSRVLAAAGDAVGASQAGHDAESLFAAKDAAFLAGRLAKIAQPTVTAASLVRDAPVPPRLARQNQASEIYDAACSALVDGFPDAAVAHFSDDFVYRDRRRMSGEPILGLGELRRAAAGLIATYRHGEWRTLAVRGDNLVLAWACRRDDAGNESACLDLVEVRGTVVHHLSRFDPDAFEDAYRELETRYYAGEGVAYSTGGLAVLEIVQAFFEQNLESARRAVHPGFRWFAPAASLKPLERTLEEMFEWLRQRGQQVSSQQHCVPAIQWCSPSCAVCRIEINAVGKDGERYTWSSVVVTQIRDGAIAWVREFDTEADAFTYAESLGTPKPSRLASINPASEIHDRICSGFRAHDPDLIAASYTDGFVYDDRRRLHGEPIGGVADLHVAAARLIEQYPHGEWQTLATRGQNLVLAWAHRWDEAGNESASLDVVEVGGGLIEYHGRFDPDAFEDAYRELETRYYAGEGAAYAQNGRKVGAWLEAMWRGDVATARRVRHPDSRWLEARDEQLSSMRPWLAAMHWLSPNCYIARQETRGTGHSGEDYRWSAIYVCEYPDGLAASVREFGVADEDAAFAHAESLVASRPSRLMVRNRASETLEAGFAAMRSPVTNVTIYSERTVYEDRRRMHGDPIVGNAEFRAAAQRKHEQYAHVEWRSLAVRGETLTLASARWWDDDGNTTASLDVFEVADDGLVDYHGRFDEDDFLSAYVELERRYYAGEGAAFAVGGLTVLRFQTSIWAQDLDAARLLVRPDFAWRAGPSTLKADERSLDEMFTWRAERLRQCPSFRDWLAALQWLSPDVCVARSEMRETGHVGEGYEWSRVYVTEYRDGLMASGREFDIADEDEAFASAESLVGRERTRLVVRNRASAVADGIIESFRANDSAGAGAFYSDGLTYEDRRSLAGNAVTSRQDYVSGIERLLSQYSYFDHQTLAVRGERLALEATSISDAAGNATGYLHLFELDDEDLVTYEGRFDLDDFLSAYVEFERRYYAGEGAALAANGRAAAGWVEGIGRRDIEMVRRLSTPDFRWFASRSSLKAAERTVDDMFEWLRERGQQVVSQRHWCPAYRWLSATCAVGLVEVSAIGIDGELYLWTYHTVSQFRDGLIASIREFDTEDEAFAYAESVVAPASRLAVANRASAVNGRILAGMQAGDPDATADHWADRFVYDDRRRFSGDPISDRPGVRRAFQRVFEQYNSFESQTVAVRGETLHLTWNCWSDSAGNQTSSFILAEFGDDDQIVYEARFDDNDFETAYRELEHRYYAAEGAAFAANGRAIAAFIEAMNRLDLQAARRLTGPEFRAVSPPSTLTTEERTLGEFFAWLQERARQVSSVTNFFSACQWVSPTTVVARGETRAIGPDGEEYTWTRIFVDECRDGLLVMLRQFDIDDEEAAFAHAEELSRTSPTRLAVTNRAAEVVVGIDRALSRGDAEAVVDSYREDCRHDDRRRLAGGLLPGRTELRAAVDRILQQFNDFQWHTLAVRGRGLAMGGIRWSDDAGNTSTYLLLVEVDDDERISYECWFDEHDFEGAYRELERRYYAGEGAAFAANGRPIAAFIEAMNRLDVESARRLCLPTFRWRSPAATLTAPERTLDEFFGWLQERARQTSAVDNFSSVVHWLSPECFVALGDVRAVGADGAEYRWTRIYVGEFGAGLLASMREFDEEEEAFAYAEARVRTAANPLPTTNRASDSVGALLQAMKVRDCDAVLACYSDHFVFDDHRSLTGDPIQGTAAMRAAIERIFRQFTCFEARLLAVRGERLCLWRSRWSDDVGNESAYLHVFDVDDDGLIARDERFDSDDFEGAYQELERRHYVDEGGPFADTGLRMANYVIALNRGEFDRLFDQLSCPDLHIQNRSRFGFADRSAAELRTSLEDLKAMLDPLRAWFSSVRFVSPRLFVARMEREGVGADGEQYAWTRTLVCKYCAGRLASICDFDADDEAAAFSWALKQVSPSDSGD